MSGPGVGSIVIYHSGNGYDLPAIVVGTHDSYNAAFGTNEATQPDAGKVHLVAFGLASGYSPKTNVPEGAGGFDLLGWT